MKLKVGCWSVAVAVGVSASCCAAVARNSRTTSHGSIELHYGGKSKMKMRITMKMCQLSHRRGISVEEEYMVHACS